MWLRVNICKSENTPNLSRIKSGFHLENPSFSAGENGKPVKPHMKDIWQNDWITFFVNVINRCYYIVTEFDLVVGVHEFEFANRPFFSEWHLSSIIRFLIQNRWWSQLHFFFFKFAACFVYCNFHFLLITVLFFFFFSRQPRWHCLESDDWQ